MRIDVRVDVQKATRALFALRSDIADKAVSRALNEVAKQGRTQMVRGISQEFNITQSDVRDAVFVRLSRPASDQLVAELRAMQRKRGRGFNLARFLEKQTTLAQARKRRKAGTVDQLHFQIKKSGGRVVIPGAFIGNKGRTVFKRVGKERLPIKAVTTIDIAQMFNTKRINGRVVDFMRQKFPEILKREIAYYVQRAG